MSSLPSCKANDKCQMIVERLVWLVFASWCLSIISWILSPQVGTLVTDECIATADQTAQSSRTPQMLEQDSHYIRLISLSATELVLHGQLMNNVCVIIDQSSFLQD